MKRSLAARAVSAILILTFATSQAAYARFTDTFKPGMNFFSPEQEVQVGQQAEQQAEQEMPQVTDQRIVGYVQHLGQKLAAHAPGNKYPYRFHVVNQKEINAFALPGGPVFVNLGTIQAADNEAQLAGVIAHEISHVALRHATHNASKEMLAQAPLSILGGMLGNGILGNLAKLGISFGAQSVFLKYSRDAEKQADLSGADIMYDTGYDPRQMAAFFEKLQAEGGPQTSQFFSDHPNPGNRVQYVSAEVRTLPSKQFVQDSADFRQIKQIVSGTQPMTAQQIAQWQKTHAGQAGTQQAGPMQSPGDISADSNFKTLNHSAFQIGYPQNWQAYGDQSSAVTIAPAGGISQDAVAYGVMINGYQPEGTQTLDNATHELVTQLRQSNPDMRQIGNDEDITVNGVAGKSIDLTGTSPIQANGKSQKERDWLVTLQRSDGSIIYLVFVAPENDFRRLQPTYENMLRSMRLR